MPTRNAYIGTIALFVVTFAFQLTSLFDPKWVRYTSPEPFYTETNYGLFQKCSSLTDDCRRFPQKSWGDCDQDKGSGRWVKLCGEWRVAAGLNVAAAIFGLVILFALGTVLYSGERWHANGWKHVLGLMGIFAGLQVMSMGLIAHVAQTSSMFVHHHYGLSFVLSNVSWVFATALAIGVMLYAKYAAQGRIALE
ncbi:hypothetical protein BX616_009447 [Lobosporangium transversale]|uniref:Actin cortical patch SUR7/pH-response regulator pali n=1 Tax=Lobosporangium transversale TaxID=64571 RepID=A0A1Y2G6K8_9FUNG|nr:hypothetical protein BCR41DRAFT_427034 [Lobosporangium transversale]KAF9913855.1 hypothetical protein BX616_009447 [Lobosporangium transversale]ORY92977.1 hypothetical protein BCR41DRAFT_427034 [Lobosporangium transversale]|eukprot:XP_021875134.1 hypothetical protein BCR41DRAFT_427034 [Lobosporangium transversale]